MRYNKTELETGVFVEGVFNTGETVTLKLYDKSVGLEIPVDINTCHEITGTGKFLWSTANITTMPVTFKQYSWTMTDSQGTQKDGAFDALGWADSVGGGSIPTPANMCKITVQLSDGDNDCGVQVNDLYDPNVNNIISIKKAYHADGRYFKLGDYQPSFDQQTGQAYWLIPQGAVVDVLMDSFGLQDTEKIVPMESTIDLHTWINL